MKFAFVTLVMRGDDYIPGAIAVALSLKYVKTVAATVCMVTPDVRNVKALEAVFDRVVTVKYLEYKSKKMKSEASDKIYTTWADVSYTKWNCLALKEYDKILFIDADTILVKNMDHLFTLDAPAATFSSPWASDFTTEKYVGKKTKNGVVEDFSIKYPKEHGAEIKADLLMSELQKGGYAFIASLVLLKPADGFEQWMSKQEQPFGMDNFSMADEQSLALYYAEQKISWRHIHQKYNFIIHKPTWLAKDEVPHMLHYFNKLKPWHTKQTWKTTPWNTERLWWYMWSTWQKPLLELPNAQKPGVFPVEHVDQRYFPWIDAVLRSMKLR